MDGRVQIPEVLILQEVASGDAQRADAGASKAQGLNHCEARARWTGWRSA